MSRFDRSMSPVALILSILALVVATSAGSAYAAAKIGSSQIKNGAITSAKIRSGAVAPAKIAPNAVTAAKIAPNAVGGSRIQDRSITTADLAPATINALRATPTYWAYITQGGAVGRGSAGVTSEAQLNGGFWQYRVTFPRDISACGYQVSSGDGAALGSNEYVIPAIIGVARSTQGPRTLAVNVFRYSDGQSIQDTFFLAVTC